MTILSDYVAGTIGLTNGQTAFTGTGTAWLSAGLGEGDKIYVDGFFGGQKIAAISAEGAGALAFAWPGATGTYAYRMEFLASPSRAAAKAQTAIDLLTSGLFQEVDAVGTFAGRDTFDGQPEGFVYASETDEAGNAVSGFWIVYQKKSNADADWSIGAKTGGADGRATNYSALGSPPGALGADGETYLNVSNGDIYLKSAGTWAVTSNIRGIDAGLKFSFSNTITMADPGAGYLRQNNANLGAVTAVAIADQTANPGNPDISGFITTWGDSNSAEKGLLRISKRTAQQNFVLFAVTGLTDNAGWSELAVTYLAGAGSFTAEDDLVVVFVRTGESGTFIRYGSGAPSGGLGVDGDFYLDTLNLDLYGPKASGSWGSATTIITANYVINIDGGDSVSTYGGVPIINGGDST